MFICERYFNEDNISTIDYKITTSMKDFEIYKYVVDDVIEFYQFNKTQQKISLLNPDSYWGKSWEIVSEDELQENQEKLKSLQESYAENGDERYGVSQRDVEEQLSKVNDMKVYLYLQKNIFKNDHIKSFVYNYGYITVTIKMNNSDIFNEDILNWFNQENFDIETEDIFDENKIARQYQDTDINIDYIYNYLYKKKEKRKI